MKLSFDESNSSSWPTRQMTSSEIYGIIVPTGSLPLPLNFSNVQVYAKADVFAHNFAVQRLMTSPIAPRYRALNALSNDAKNTKLAEPTKIPLFSYTVTYYFVIMSSNTLVIQKKYRIVCQFFYPYRIKMEFLKVEWKQVKWLFNPICIIIR